MPSETTATSDPKRAAKPGVLPVLPPPEQEQLPCPRCESTNTKFCYYNNYNFSQPRHFCKSCRRYWTHGGTLRDIPVGGGTRKTAKRCRTTTITDSVNSTSAASASVVVPSSEGVASAPFLVPFAAGKSGASLQYQYGGGGEQGKAANFFWALGGPLGLGLEGKENGPAALCGSFTSLLSNPGHGGGFGHGFDEMGFGLGRGIWPFQATDDGGLGATNAAGGVGNNNNNNGGGGGPNGWQFESGDSGFVGGGGSDCLSWPDLSISTLGGNGFK